MATVRVMIPRDPQWVPSGPEFRAAVFLHEEADIESVSVSTEQDIAHEGVPQRAYVDVRSDRTMHVARRPEVALRIEVRD